jgi:hypothetical protein
MNVKVIIATAIAVTAFGTANARFEGGGGGGGCRHICRIVEAPAAALRCTSRVCKVEVESSSVPTLAAK